MEQVQVGKGFEISLLNEQSLEAFFNYLDEQLSESGKGEVSLFQPLSRSHSGMTDEMKLRFSQGLVTQYGELGWRQVWVAKDCEGNIQGHIDLRGHPEEHTQHRALLGMGVRTQARRTGLGKRFIQTVEKWAIDESELVWLDLWVLSNNKPAIGLYESTGFKKLGEVEDMFRIDNESHHFTRMAKRLRG